MEYIIGVIVIVIVGMIVGFIMRKRIYDEVDRLENWKLSIMNREVAEELAKVKSLNLSGQTQERFEAWRDEWDRILSKQLPELEEILYDAEEKADKYRFQSAKKVLGQLEQHLLEIDQSIDNMFQELETLLSSERDGREEMEEILPQIKKLRKQLLQHRHHYGKSEAHFEQQLNEIAEETNAFHEHIENGNYLEAHELVQQLKEQLDAISVQIEEFPKLFRAVKQEYPSQLDELLAGVKEMTEDDYRIEQFQYEQEITEYKELLQKDLQKLEQVELKEVREHLEELDQRIQDIYAQLEREALARSYIEKQQPILMDKMEETIESAQGTKKEVNILQTTYYLKEKDIETFLGMEQWLKKLLMQFEDIQNQIDGSEELYSSIREQMEEWETQFDKLVRQHNDYKEFLHTLRKDEWEAKEKIDEMKQDLVLIHRKLKKSNIPGVPIYLQEVLQHASNSLEQVATSLDSEPFNLSEMQEELNQAVQSVDRAKEQTNLVLDQADFAETLIQYANRYRSKNPSLAKALHDSEQAFRQYDYDRAVQQASDALERVEPGAVKRLEELEEVSIV
ncbi:selenide, water dikinase [Pontibacillus halophilus JSM 076056 = DSM 19796]|uniref:Septation ring formation regulator EzrA n=1 Tax=Pontibacillus halophilus JSM 076056 = DSM 19796 TaxID=1385510 RepID=A0A0A5GQ20_9BACI|nr:septation ring formation regulator EzrA [Pontibacillus halophilus]KGX93343.1 selenide, water dikinase [Pontibacillus halophilus JSM 076056 = DSM 19796]